MDKIHQQVVKQDTQIDLYGPRRSMVLRYQHGLRCQPRPQVVTWLSTATRATNFNIDPDCGRIRNPDVGPDHKSRLGFIMARMAAQVISICMALVAPIWMASGVRPGLGHSLQ